MAQQEHKLTVWERLYARLQGNVEILALGGFPPHQRSISDEWRAPSRIVCWRQHTTHETRGICLASAVCEVLDDYFFYCGGSLLWSA